MIGPVLERLNRQLGRPINSEDVLDAARHPDSELHQYFEWDDDVAAEQYRRLQAGQLIRSVTIEVIDRSSGSNEPKAVRAFLNVVTTPEEPEAKPQKGYVSFDTVRNDKDLIAQVIAQYGERLRKDAEAYETYKKFPEFASAFAAVHAEIEKLPKPSKKPAPFVGGA